MKRLIFVFLTMLPISLVGRSTLAEKPKLKNYILFPIKTELQRTLMSSTSADAYVELDVFQALQDWKLAPEEHDVESLQTDLAALAQQTGAKKPSVQLYLRYANVSASDEERKTLEKAVVAVCKKAGFQKVGTGGKFEGETWQQKLANVANLSDAANATEAPIENELVRVYPVRTVLSHFLLGDPTCDCVVELRQPIDGRFKQLSPSTRQAIAESIAKLNLPQKRKINFRCTTTTAGGAVAEKYFAARDGNPPPVAEVLGELGFQTCNFSTTPMGVSPEDLLGKPAPDFTLESLAGGQIHLQDAIRDRAAIIAFWGLACGSCRLEAPHLTELQKQFGDQRFAVIAVNGYDDSKEDVAKYVQDNKLTQQIALMGKKVAVEKYTVTSYPVTFLIDKSGIIVDYHLGFDQGDEKILSAAVDRLLKEPSGAGTR